MPGAARPSIISIDRKARTATLPVFEGRTATGAATEYIVTESSDRADAAARGVTFAPKLKLALGSKAVQTVTKNGDVITFPGTVDFSPKSSLVPNKKTGFPPVSFKPGSVGDATYGPLITSGDGAVLDAPQIANDSGQGDYVQGVDKAAKTAVRSRPTRSRSSSRPHRSRASPRRGTSRASAPRRPTPGSAV